MNHQEKMEELIRRINDLYGAVLMLHLQQMNQERKKDEIPQRKKNRPSLARASMDQNSSQI